MVTLIVLMVGIPLSLWFLGRLVDGALEAVDEDRPEGRCPYEIEREQQPVPRNLEMETEIPAVVAARRILEEARGRG